MADEVAVVAQSDATEQQQVTPEPQPDAEPKPDGEGEGEQAQPTKDNPEHPEERRKRLGGWQRQRDRALKEAEYWRNVALGTAPKPVTENAQPKAEPKPKPKMDDFESMDAYLDARDAWVSEQAVNQALEKIDSRTKAEKQQSEQQTQQERWNTREVEFAETTEDYGDVTADAVEILRSSWGPAAQAIRDALAGTDDGPELLYALGKHPEELSRMVKMNPLAAVIELGKLTAKGVATPTPAAPSVPTPPPPPQTKAPAPPTPVTKPSPSRSVDLNDPNTPVDVWLKERNKQLQRR